MNLGDFTSNAKQIPFIICGWSFARPRRSVRYRAHNIQDCTDSRTLTHESSEVPTASLGDDAGLRGVGTGQKFACGRKCLQVPSWLKGKAVKVRWMFGLDQNSYSSCGGEAARCLVCWTFERLVLADKKMQQTSRFTCCTFWPCREV